MNLYELFIDFLNKLNPIIWAIVLIIVIAYFFKTNDKKNQTKPKQVFFAKKELAKGVVFGKKNRNTYAYSSSDKEGSIFVAGGSGKGKTSAILIPTLNSWQGTSYVIDISGDIYKNATMSNKIVFQPSSSATTPYNVFGIIDSIPNEADQREALEQLAFMIMPDDPNASDSGRFFTTEGRKILTASLIAFYYQDMDFIDICEKIVGSSYVNLFSAIDKTENQHAIQYINSFVGTSETNTAGCKQACDGILKLFATNDKVKNALKRSDNSITPTTIDSKNVFIIIEDERLELFAPLLHLITAQCMNYMASRTVTEDTNNILFCLDEFASLGKLEITAALRKYRKKKVRIMVLTQSLADLDLTYGRNERMAMMDNFPFKAVLGAGNTETQEYFAKLIGYEKIKKTSTTKSSRNTSTTESESREWAIEPSDLDRLGDNLILIHPDGWLKLKKNYYYK